jgi:hypothetical protein
MNRLTSSFLRHPNIAGTAPWRPAKTGLGKPLRVR